MLSGGGRGGGGEETGHKALWLRRNSEEGLLPSAETHQTHEYASFQNFKVVLL